MVGRPSQPSGCRRCLAGHGNWVGCYTNQRRADGLEIMSLPSNTCANCTYNGHAWKCDMPQVAQSAPQQGPLAPIPPVGAVSAQIHPGNVVQLQRDAELAADVAEPGYDDLIADEIKAEDSSDDLIADGFRAENSCDDLIADGFKAEDSSDEGMFVNQEDGSEMEIDSPRRPSRAPSGYGSRAPKNEQSYSP